MTQLQDRIANCLCGEERENIKKLLGIAIRRLYESIIILGDSTNWYGSKLIINKDIMEDSNRIRYEVGCAYIRNLMALTLMINYENTELVNKYYEYACSVFEIESKSDLFIDDKYKENYIESLLNGNIYPHEEFEVCGELDECIIFNCRLSRISVQRENTFQIYVVGAVDQVFNRDTKNIEITDYITSKGNRVREIIEAKHILNSLLY